MNENTINADVTMGGATDALLAGRYRVVKQLGQGGMGSVWLAEDVQLDNRQVAIKMLPSVLVANKRAYNQLKSEALVSLKLTHPNIATVRAFEENSGNPFLVVDYIDGITLDDYLAEKSKLSEEEMIRLLKPIATALDYAHSKGVIHRDVKPGNVMIAKDGMPYILDFGIAREIQETMTRVTGKLSSGTLLYMSPEQLHGAVPTPAQDVYSFAAMSYECLTGHPPFSRGQIEYQIEHDEPETLPSHIAISDGIMAGLAKRPEDRSANCAAVLAGDGGRGATALPVHDETAAASDGRARTPAAPHTPSSPHENGRARAPRIAPPSELAALGGYPREPRRWPVIVALFAVVILVGAGLFHFFSVENEKRRNLAVAQASYERVRVSLKEQLRELEGVSHEDGFGSRIEEIESQVPLESTLRDAPSFLRAVECCEKLEQESRRLVSANALRIQSKSARDAARKSKQTAQTQYASQDAQPTWQEAESVYSQGQREFAQFDFERSLQAFTQSGRLYEKAATEAISVRAERQKVEQQRREKQAIVDELRKKREKEIADSREACEEVRRQAVEVEANKFAFNEMQTATQSFLAAEKAAEANQQQAYQTAMKAFERAREVAQEASKPKVTLKAMLNGKEVNATVVSGLASKDEKTPVVVDLSGLNIGTSCEFKLAYVYDGVAYEGTIHYSVKRGTGALSVEMFRCKDYDDRVVQCRTAARRGDPNAQNNIGRMFEKGVGVVKDYTEAMKWYRKAADQGHADAQHNLGMMYDCGFGVAKNADEAMKWYRMAAEHGSASAQTHLGSLYNLGRLVERDLEEAVRWYRKAAAQGDATAQNILGLMYENGSGVTKDVSEAKMWYSLSAAQGNNLAKEGLSRLKSVHSPQLARKDVSTVPANSKVTTYRVVSGDTLSLVAQAFGVTVDDIVRLNHLQSRQLTVGQILRIKVQ